MTGPELKRIWATIDNEGFDYAFTHYSNFEEIKDEQFHKLREEFLAARKALANYVGDPEE